ncbi:unnamed protein product [Lepidochelys olivacea]
MGYFHITLHQKEVFPFVNIAVRKRKNMSCPSKDQWKLAQVALAGRGCWSFSHVAHDMGKKSVHWQLSTKPFVCCYEAPARLGNRGEVEESAGVWHVNEHTKHPILLENIYICHCHYK